MKKEHIEILKDLARNKATCRVIMKAEREALEAAISALQKQGVSPEWVLQQLAGFPGAAYDFMKRCLEEET